MRYNPKARLDDSQVVFRNGRPGGHNFYSRFDAMEDAKKKKNRTAQKSAMVRRIQKKRTIKGGPFKSKSDRNYY